MQSSTNPKTNTATPLRRPPALIVGLLLLAAACQTDSSAASDDEPSGPTAESRSAEQTETSSEQTDTASEPTPSPDAGRESVDLRLQRSDIKRIFSTLRDALDASGVATKWSRADSRGERPLVTIAPFANRVGGSISTGLTSLTARLETFLVNDMPVDLVNFDSHHATYRKLRKRHDSGRATLVAVGRKLGLDAIVTGSFTANRPLNENTRRITYTVTLRVLEVSSGDVSWESSTTLQKGPPK